MDLKIEKVPLASLSHDPANVRKHPDRNVDAIKASLTRFGQQHPIVIDADNVVRVGNGRLEAMRQLGWTECQVVRTPLAGNDAAAYAVADNRTSELATWDLDGLDVLLKDLSINGFDVNDVGFSEGDLAVLLGPSEWEKPAKEKDEEPEAREFEEKITVSITDMMIRSDVTESIKRLIEERGWNEIVRVK